MLLHTERQRITGLSGARTRRESSRRLFVRTQNGLLHMRRTQHVHCLEETTHMRYAVDCMRPPSICSIALDSCFVRCNTPTEMSSRDKPLQRRSSSIERRASLQILSQPLVARETRRVDGVQRARAPQGPRCNTPTEMHREVKRVRFREALQILHSRWWRARVCERRVVAQRRRFIRHYSTSL